MRTLYCMLLLIFNFILFFDAIISNPAPFLEESKQNKKFYNLVHGLPNICITENSERIGTTWLHKVWDQHLIESFYQLLPSDRYFVVLDLGAQTGSFSLLANYFPHSQWYAFEPIKEATDELKKNLELNTIKNVTVFEQAVADYTGLITLHMPDMNQWGLATIGPNVERFTLKEKRIVKCIDLDSFIKDYRIPKVDFIKIDTEGAEFKILCGAQQLIARDHPIILMEYNETNMKQCNTNPVEIDNFLQKMGYTWQLISHEDILCKPII